MRPVGVSHLVVGRRGLEVDGVVLRGHVGLQAVARLPQLVFAVLSGQAPREGDEVDVSVGVRLLHLLLLRPQLLEVVAHPAQRCHEQDEQRDAQEVEEDAGRGEDDRQEMQVNVDKKKRFRMKCLI